MAAILEITQKLKETGLSETEIDYLLARFLEEEAFNYVNYMEDVSNLFVQKENAVIN